MFDSHTPIFMNLHTFYYGKSLNSCLYTNSWVTTRKTRKTAKMRHIWTNLGSRASPNISAYRDRGTLFDSPEEFVPRPLKMDT